MVKTKKTKKSKGRGGTGRASGARRALPSVENGRVAKHAGMALDPCNGDLGPTAYRGRDGFVQRFSAIAGLSSATDTCGVVAYYPRYNRWYIRTMLNTGTAIVPDFYDATYSSAGPGGTYLVTNASAHRVVGACLDSFYTGTELDRQGMTYRGNIVASAFVGKSTTLAALIPLLQVHQRTPDVPVATKWIPAPVNEEYFRTNASAGTFDDQDNIIIFTCAAFGANKILFNFKATLVSEWQPNTNLGLTVSSPNTVDAVGGFERVRNILHSFGNFWYEAKTTARIAAQVYRGMRDVAQVAAPRVLSIMA